MPNGARNKTSDSTNRYTPDTLSDSDRSPHTAIVEWWKGGQAEQAAWLYGRIKAAEDDYGFCQLNTTGVRPLRSAAFTMYM